MIEQEIITNLVKTFDQLRRQYEDLTPILEVVAALIDRAITENFEKRGRWDGDEDNITIFSGGNERWRPLAQSTMRKYKDLGFELAPTLNRTKGLMSTIEVRPYTKTAIIISVASPYGAIHQYGGEVNPTIPVTQKMRSYFWFKYYTTRETQWKAMALTKKKEFTPEINIPARPYITLTKEDLKEIIEFMGQFITRQTSP